ncbi:MAG: DNA repair exonuclease [Thaumarchaeota archaeon S15]|nr:MAG: DNA repair exonuclease [Thaumarchaeota archaeon S15]
MKFSHIADIHLGQTQYREREREDDMYLAFQEAVDVSINDHVDFVILSGDLFHQPSPSGRAMVVFAKILKRLNDSGIKAYFILGDHDINNTVETPVAHVYDRLGVATHIGDGEPIKHDGVLLCGFDRIKKNEMPDYEERFTNVDAIAKRHDGHKILVMHQGITEIGKFTGNITIGEMPKEFSYYAMGHLHNRYERRFDKLGGILAYPGSTERTDVEGINGTKKGFYQVDISGKEASTQWIGLNTRPHLVFDVEYNNMVSRVNKITAEVSTLKKRPVVQINVSGSSIDRAAVHEATMPIRNIALYLKTKIMRTEIRDDGVEILSEKSFNMNSERVRLVEKTLGDSLLSKFALDTLLPLLSTGKIDEALEVVFADYKKFRTGCL